MDIVIVMDKKRAGDGGGKVERAKHWIVVRKLNLTSPNYALCTMLAHQHGEEGGKERD